MSKIYQDKHFFGKMAKQRKRQRKFAKKLLHKYRLVILNEDTFEERFAIKLTRLNVFVITSLLAIFLIVGTIVLIAFTPLKEYIPGYSSTELKKKATELNYKTDSLQLQNARARIHEEIPEKALGVANTVRRNAKS